MFKIKCFNCKKIVNKFWDLYYLKSTKRHFCSKKCYWKWLKDNERQSSNPNWRSIIVKCYWCKNKIFRTPYRLKIHKYQFCSKKCQNEWHSEYFSGKKFRITTKIEIKCEYCGKKRKFFPSWLKGKKHHFCNFKCYRLWFSKNISKDKKPVLKKKIPNCLICNKKLSRHSYKYCVKCKSIGCNNSMYGKKHSVKTKNKMGKIAKERLKNPENNPNWKGGKSFEPYSFEFNNELKEKIRKRDNYICQNCNITEEEYIIVFGTFLHIHHIDYDKNNCKENNLITLCNSCNMRANHNRLYWKKYYKNKMENLYVNN